MKYLKKALIVLAALILLFLLLGVFKSEIAYDCEVIANKPLAESWAVSQDEQKMSDWLDGFQKFEHVSGTPGTVGAVSDVYFINGGEEMVIRETITDIVPNESVSMLFTSDFMNMDYKLTMTDLGQKTKINTSTIAKGNGVVSKSILAFMGGSMKTQEETNLNRLKKTIEENSKVY